MPGFQFRFASILKLREQRRDQCRQLLAEALADDRELVQRWHALERQRSDLLNELKTIGQAGAVDVDRAAARRYFAGKLLLDMRGVEDQRDRVRERVQLCRRALAQAERDVKVFEKLEHRQHAEFVAGQFKTETREREEAWLALHRDESVL